MFEIRYIPGGSGRLALPSTLLCEPLQSFKKVIIYLYLPRSKVEVPGPFGSSQYIPQKDQPVVSEFIASLVSALEVEDEDMRERYEVWRVEAWDIPGLAHLATKARLWPEVTEEEEAQAKSLIKAKERQTSITEKMGAMISGEKSEAGSSKDGEKAGGPKQEVVKERKNWDRETNLRLLGGLVNLRLESKKHG